MQRLPAAKMLAVDGTGRHGPLTLPTSACVHRRLSGATDCVKWKPHAQHGKYANPALACLFTGCDMALTIRENMSELVFRLSYAYA